MSQWQRANSAALDYVVDLKQGKELQGIEAVAELVEQMDQHVRRSLWYELGQDTLHLVGSLHGQPLDSVYTRFVVHFESHLNALLLARILRRISESLTPEHALAFLDARIPSFRKAGAADSDATLLLVAAQAFLHLRLEHADAGRSALDEVEQALERRSQGVDPLVRAAYHRSLAFFHAQRGHHSEYYQQTLRYLSYAKVDGIPAHAKRTLAKSTLTAALVGEDAYNFGDLLQHPLMGFARDDDDVRWLAELVRLVHTGDVAAYRAYSAQNAGLWAQEKDLVQWRERVDEKVAILALIGLAVSEQASRSAIPFARVAEATGVSENLVEMLIMRALSLGLLRGELDGQTAALTVSWVRPRVLDRSHVILLKDRVSEWQSRVHETLRSVESELQIS